MSSFIHKALCFTVAAFLILPAAGCQQSANNKNTQNTKRERREIDPDRKQGGYLGIVPGAADSGLLVGNVQQGMPAQKSGILPGDLILSIDQIPLHSVEEAIEILSDYYEGDSVTVKLKRGQEELDMTVMLAARPEFGGAESLGLRNIERPDEGTRELSAADHTYRPMPPDANPLSRETLKELGMRCGAGVNWYTDYDAAVAAARAENKPILWSFGKALDDRTAVLRDYKIPYSPTYEGLDYDIYLRSTLFTYPSTRDLINTQFIPLRAKITPEQAKEWNIVPFEFIEPGFLILSPYGRRLHAMDRVNTFNEIFFHHALRNVLKANAQWQPVSDEEARLDAGSSNAEELYTLAACCHARGDVEAAAAHLQKAFPLTQSRKLQCRISLLHGRCLRLLSDPKALGQLQTAQLLESAVDSATRAEIAAELSLAHMHNGDYDQARAASEAILAKYGRSAVVPETLFRLGQIAWLMRDEAQAQNHWKELCRAFPGADLAGAAAQYLSGQGPLTHSMEDFGWLADDALAQAVPSNTGLTVDEFALHDRAGRAVRWLLAQQRSDGSWSDSAYKFMGAEHRYNTFTAVTAIAAAALLEWREVDPVACEKALARAEAYLLNPRNLSVTSVEKIFAYSYSLIYWVKRLNNSAASQRDKIRAEITRLLERIKDHQADDGAWGHEYYNPFASAMVMIALRHAQDAGFELSDAHTKKCLVMLKQCRGKDGGFPYMHGMPGTLIDGVGRSPMCELARYYFGESDQSALVSVLSNFFANKQQLERTRQYDYHADEHANGGFFFYYCLYPVSETITCIEDPAARSGFEQALIGMMCKIPEIDGSWVDSANIGKGYGTGMALLVLDNARNALAAMPPVSDALRQPATLAAQGKYADARAALDTIAKTPKGRIPETAAGIEALRNAMNSAVTARVERIRAGFAADPKAAVGAGEAFCKQFENLTEAASFAKQVAEWKASADYRQFVEQDEKLNAALSEIATLGSVMTREQGDALIAQLQAIAETCPGNRIGQRAAAEKNALADSFKGTGFLGITPGQEESGVVIGAITPGYAAARAGLKEGDIFLKADGNDVADVEKFMQFMRSTKPGQTVEFVVRRGDETQTVSVVLGRRVQ